MRKHLIVASLAALALTLVFGAVAGQANADYRSTVMADGPSNYFRMDDSGATMVNEEAGGELDGTHEGPPGFGAQGALTHESPNFSIAYFGDADMDRSLFPINNLVSTYDKFSIEFFVWTGAASLPGAAQWYEGYGLVDGEMTGVTSDAGTALIHGGLVGFGLGSPDTTIASTTPVNDGFWHHVVAISDGEGLMRLYVDGVLEAEKSGGPSDPRTNTQLAIGAFQTNNGHQFPGLIDEVAFYRHTLTGTDVAEHYAASSATPVTPPPLPRNVPLIMYVGGGGTGEIQGPGSVRCPGGCFGEFQEGSTPLFVAAPAANSRFSFFYGNDCVPEPVNACRVRVDNPILESVSANFHLKPKQLGQNVRKANSSGAKLEKVLDGIVNPGKKSDIYYPNIQLQAFGAELGQAGGALVTASDKAGLVGNAGNTLIGSDGATFTVKAPDPAPLIGSDGATLIGSDGGTLIGSDGATLIGPDGATVISRDGAGFTRRAAWTSSLLAGSSAAKQAQPKYKNLVIGRYAQPIGDHGQVKVIFKLTTKGREILKTFGEMNLELKKRGMKPVALHATLLEVVQPSDEHGTGGTFEKVSIK